MWTRRENTFKDFETAIKLSLKVEYLTTVEQAKVSTGQNTISNSWLLFSIVSIII